MSAHRTVSAVGPVSDSQHYAEHGRSLTGLKSGAAGRGVMNTFPRSSFFGDKFSLGNHFTWLPASTAYIMEMIFKVDKKKSTVSDLPSDGAER